jgi:hypothetical protein
MSPPDRQISDTGRNSREHGKALPPEFGRLSFAGRGMPGRSAGGTVRETVWQAVKKRSFSTACGRHRVVPTFSMAVSH